MSLRGAAARGVVWAAIETFGRQGLAFLFFIVLSRLLEPSEIGLVAAAMILVGLMELLTTQGFPTAIIQLPSLSRQHLDSVFALSIGSAVILGVLTFFAAPYIAVLIDNPGATPVLRWLILLLPVSAVAVVPTGLLLREMRFNALAHRTLVATTVGGVVGMVMAFRGFGVWSLVGYHLVAAVVGAVWLVSAVSWRPRLRVSGRHLREVLPVSGSLLGTGLVSFGRTRVDRAIIGAALGTSALGHYAIGARMVEMLQVAVMPLMKVAVPTLSAVQEDSARVLRAYYSLTRTATLVGFPLCVGAGLTAHLAVPLVFGDKWLPAVPVVQILCIGGALQALFIGTHPLAVARDKTHIILFTNILQALTALLGAWIGAEWGIVGVAVGVTCSSTIGGLVGLVVVQRVLGVSILRFFESAALATWACAAMAAAVVVVLSVARGYSLVGWLQLMVAVTVGILFYGTIICILTPQPIEQFLSQVRLLRMRSSIPQTMVPGPRSDP